MNSTGNFDNLVQDFDLNQFLTQNKHLDAESYLLRHKGNTNQLNWLLAEQLKIYPKASHKLPEFVKHHCWFTSKSYEQSSSESSAIFKSKRFSGQTLLDLSGGLGVDDWAFSRTFKQVISLDPNAELNQLVRINNQNLGIKNIQRIDTKAEDYMPEAQKHLFDLVYLDADRRPDEKRAWFLEQVQPNYLELASPLHKICKQILLKVSPMVDLTYLKESIQHLKEIWVLGDSKEVKEVLVLIEPNYEGSVRTEAIELKTNGEFDSFLYEPKQEEQSTNPIQANYFFEPHPVIIKAGLSKIYATSIGLNQIAPESAFYLGANLPSSFMGRAFRILAKEDFSKATLKEYLKRHKLKQANVTRRNFILSTDDIRKQFKLKDGGEEYLFFTEDAAGKRIFVHAQKP